MPNLKPGALGRDPSHERWTALQGHIEGISRGITDRDNPSGPQASGRTSIRHSSGSGSRSGFPTRIQIDEFLMEYASVSGMTCTVVVTGKVANGGSHRWSRIALGDRPSAGSWRFRSIEAASGRLAGWQRARAPSPQTETSVTKSMKAAGDERLAAKSRLCLQRPVRTNFIRRQDSSRRSAIRVMGGRRPRARAPRPRFHPQAAGTLAGDRHRRAVDVRMRNESFAAHLRHLPQDLRHGQGPGE